MFSLRLFGGFALQRGGEPVAISVKKSRALLAYLALHPDRIHAREKLATLLWGDRFDKQARQSLRQAITILRRELAVGDDSDIFIGDREQLGIDRSAIEIDVQKFREAMAGGTESAIRGAIELYRGDLLPGFTADAEEFDGWLDQERRRLRSLAQDAYARLARGLAASARGDEAIEMAQRLVDVDPAEEASHQLLIEVYGRFRGRDAAVRQFEICAAVLRRELDVAPSPRTLEIVRSIRNGIGAEAVPPAPASPAPAVDVLPPAGQPHRRSRRVAAAAIAAVGAALAAAAWLAATGPWTAASGPAAATATASAPAAPRQGRAFDRHAPFSIVVLPFSDYSDHGNTSIAEAMTDDLTTDISLISGSFVIARATAQTYAGRTADIKAIGRELGVRYALEGGVRLADGQLRINADLVDIETGTYVWARRFTGDSGRRFDVQDELIAALINEVFVEMSLLDAVRSARDRPESPELEDFLTRGRAARLRGPTAENIAEARAQYAQALRMAPDSLFAMAGLAAAHVHGVLQLQSESPEHDLAEAEALIGRVLAAELRCYFCWFVNGQIERARGRFEDAVADWQHSLDINASYPHAYAQIGSTLMYLGRAEETRGYLEHAMRLSPRDPMVPLWQMMMGAAELLLGRDQAAVDLLRQSVASNLRIPRTYRLLAAALELTGDEAGARSMAAAFRALAASRGPQSPPEEAYISNPVYLGQRARIAEAARRAGL